MHLNKLLEQIKRHQSPTEAIDKLATALEKHEGSLRSYYSHRKITNC